LRFRVFLCFVFGCF